MTGSFFGYPVIDFLHPFITDGGKIFGVPLNAEQVFFCVSPSFGSSVRGRCIDFHIGNRIIRHHCFPVAGIGQNMSFADNVGQRRKRCNKYIVRGQFFGFMFQRRLGVFPGGCRSVSADRCKIRSANRKLRRAELNR